MICVSSITVSPSIINVKQGSWNENAKATVYPASASCRVVRWDSCDPSIATVNPILGHIYGMSPGIAKIYAKATDGSGVRGYCTVIVSKEELCPGSGSSSGSCPGSGTGSSSGSGSCSGSGTGSSSCPGTGNILASSITVSPSSATLKINKSIPLVACISPSNATGRLVTWCSSNPSVASVGLTSGIVTAYRGGSATIYATAADGSGVRGTCEIIVDDDVLVTSIQIHGDACPMYIGDMLELDATVCPANATNQKIKWSSSNPNVAAVVSLIPTKGFVTAKSAGQAIIYAKAQDGSGVQARWTVNVKPINICPVPEKPKGVLKEYFVADPIDVYSGAHVLKNTIMSLYGGQGLSLTVHYDSTKLSSGVFGAGWYHNYEKQVEICGCEARVYISPSVYSKYQSGSDCNIYTCTTPHKNGYVLHVDCTQQYPYIVNCNSERTEYYDSNGRLAKIIDHQGFETLISYSDTLITITDTVSGRSMYLEKDLNGRIARVYDDAGREAKFTYCEDLLTGVCDVNNKSMTYTYNEEGQVLTGTDSMNICYFENTYDEYGRVATQKDAIAGSRTSIFEYGCCGERITTDRNGHQSTRIFDCNGLLTSYTDENGNTKTYEYDSKYNVIKETDANGHSITKSYNSFNKPTVITDKNGNKTFFTYDIMGNVTRIQYPEINDVVAEETFVYNARNQLTQHTDVRGTVTAYTYDASAMPASKKVGSKNAVLYSYENGLLKAQTDALGHTTTYGYNAIGQMTSKTDAKNQVTSYEYDASGNLLKTTDANGNTVENTYDGNHQKTSVTDAKGYKTEYIYNGNMKNEEIKLPDNNRIRYEYDGEDRPVKVTDQAGNVTITQYDNAGRVVSKQYPDNGTVQYEYDPAGNLIKETNQKGAVTTKTYDAMGNVLSVTDGAGNLTRYQYNALSKVIRAVNAVSGTTVYEYSKAGDLLSETDPLGHKKTYTYDAYGNRLTETDARGNTTVYTYDDNNNLLNVCNALGDTTTYTYDSMNQLKSVTDAKGNIIRYDYDAVGRRTTITDAKNNVFTTVYDANGNVFQILDAKGHKVSETIYNSLNKPFRVTDAAGQTSVYTYNALGNVKTITDAMTHTQEYTYNWRGQNTNVKDALQNVSSATFDTLGNMTRLAGPSGSHTDYSYDSLGRLIAETTTSEGQITYGYNELNLKEQLTNARGQVRKYFYDVAGRITGYVGAEDSVSYTYDANGNILTVTDKNGTITRTYDALNRVSSYTDTFGKTIHYTYDAVGNLKSMTYPDNTTVTYDYDKNNNLEKVTDWSGRVTTYSYDENNKVVGVTKPDGSVTTTIYDDAQRISSTVEKTSGGTVITGFSYIYDSLGRIQEESHLANNTKMCYTYDELSRVTKRKTINLSNNCESVENFSYDAIGNVTSSVFMYDTNNRLTSYNGQTVTYDADGNMLSALLGCVTTAFEYDSANRLLKAGGNAYTYNGEDVRIRNICGSDETIYTYNTNCKLSQLLMKTTNGVVTKYVYGLGLIGEEKQGCFKTYHFDYRGSTVAITNESGVITDTFEYDTYGKLISRTGSSFVIFGYNGRDGVVTDRNGLIYMRARYYSPEHRRFVNADIVKGEITNAITLNRYAYANGNPVSNVDPFGLSPERGKQQKISEQYKDLIIKALNNTQKNIAEYYKNRSDAQRRCAKFSAAIEELIESLNNETLPNGFSNDTKIKIEINPNYNTSGDKLIAELAGLIPGAGPGMEILMSYVDYASDEKKDDSKLFDMGYSLVINLMQLQILEDLISLNNIKDIFQDWNSIENIDTEISVFVQNGESNSYWYHAIADEELIFKEMYSAYTGNVIKEDAPSYQINLL